MKLMQLSEVIESGHFAGKTVEEAIEADPRYMASLVERGELALAAGAARHLKDTLEEWDEFERFYREH